MRAFTTPWGSFRTPRRERLMADITIMSMLFESTAIVSVNGCLYLYKFNFLQNTSLLEVLEPFALTTCLQLVIEWFFTSVINPQMTYYFPIHEKTKENKLRKSLELEK